MKSEQMRNTMMSKHTEFSNRLTYVINSKMTTIQTTSLEKKKGSSAQHRIS